jgi:hypothetical protein
MLKGDWGLQPPTAPESVTIPVNRPAAALHFLGGIGGWAWPWQPQNGENNKGKVGVTVRVRYADGEVEDFQWRDGVEIADWIRREEVTGSEFAFADDAGHQVRYLVVRPSRRGAIREVELVKGGHVGLAPVVFALTVEGPTAAGAAAPAAVPAREFGPPVYTFEAGALPPGKFTVENQKTLGENFFPAGFLGHCWKNESVAEFRSGEVAGSRAFGATNFNDTLSSQVIVNLEGALGVSLTRGAEYRVRIEYRAANDAEGKVAIREPGPSYKTLAQVQLSRGSDSWKSAEFTFRKDVDKKLDLLIENMAVGEGNTLWVRKFEIFEVK